MIGWICGWTKNKITQKSPIFSDFYLLYAFPPNGEDAIRRVVAVNWDGKVMPPCGACRELMAQLMPEGYKNMEVMLDYEKNEIVTLEALTPHWWI